MESKVCHGPLHPPGGELIPLDEYTFNHKGPREGKPLSRCKRCRSTANSTTVSEEVFVPLVESILLHMSIKEAAKLSGVDRQIIRDIVEGKRKRIYKKTFFALKRAESRIPTEKISMGPQRPSKSIRESSKLNYEDRQILKQLISVAQKDRYKKDKSLLKHVV